MPVIITYWTLVPVKETWRLPRPNNQEKKADGSWGGGEGAMETPKYAADQCRMEEQPAEGSSAWEEKTFIFESGRCLCDPEVFYWMFSALTKISGIEI